MPKEFAAVFIRKRSTNRRLLLNELIPNFFVISDDLESRWQTQMVAVGLEQTDAEAVNRSKKCAVKRRQNFEWNASPQDFGARSLLHFIRCAIGERDNNQL